MIQIPRSDLLRDISQKAPVRHMFLLDRDERRQADINGLVERLGSNVYFLKARELENYLLAPHAIRSALMKKHRYDQSILASIDATTEEQIKQWICEAANTLYDLVLFKRVRAEVGGLRGGLLPSDTLSLLKPDAMSPDFPKLVEQQIMIRSNEHLAGLDVQAIVVMEKQELDKVWADQSNRLHVAPGAEILTAVFNKLGSMYNKTTDAARIAKEMQSDEIDQEIVQVIEKARALVG